MKKKTIKKKYPSIKKNTTFLALWDYYRQMQRDFLQSVRRHRETKKSLAALTAEKGTPASLKKAWKKEAKRAAASKKYHQGIVKDARRHVKKWLKAHLVWQELTDKRSELIAPAKPEETKAKKAPKKAAKPTASKKKSAVKMAKKAPTKKAESTPKSDEKKAAKKTEKTSGKKVRPEKAEKKAAAKKKLTPTIRVARTIQVATATPIPEPVAKKPVKKAAPAAAKPKPTTTAKRTTRKPAAPKPGPAARPARPDNLKRVEGIGIKIEQLLRRAGIDSFEKLSKSTLKTLRGLLDAAGPHYRAADPTTWPKQANLAHQGKWEELKKWQEELNGGRIVK